MPSEQVQDTPVVEGSPGSFGAPEIPTASNTTLEYFDGFDEYIVDSLPLYWTCIAANPFRTSDTVASEITITSNVLGRNNTQALQINRSNGWGVYRKGRLGSIPTRTVGIAVQASNFSAFQNPYLITYLDGLKPQLALVLLGTKLLQVATITDPAGDIGRVILTSTRQFPPAPTLNYHYVEMSVTFSDTVGAVRVNVDGETWISGTGLDTVNTGNNPTSDGIALGINHYATSDYLRIDDFYMKGDGVFLGKNTQVITRLPTANGTVNQWTRAGTNSGANWSQVNDIAGFVLDSKTVKSTIRGETDEYAYPAMNFPWKVHGVMNGLISRTDIAGTVELTPTINSGGTIYEGNPHTISTPNQWKSMTDIQGLDPATGQSWTVAGASAVRVGMRRTSD